MLPRRGIHCVNITLGYIDSAMIFAARSVISPPGNPNCKGVYPKCDSDWIYQSGYHQHHASSIPCGLWPSYLLLGVMFLHLNAGPTLWGYLWFIVQHGNILAFCNLSSYGSYCGVSLMHSSTKSLTSAQGAASGIGTT